MIMNDKQRNIPWVDGRLFNENCNNFPAEELLRHAGQYVAWKLDGTEILASAPSEPKLHGRLRQMGIDPSQIVGEYIPPPDMSVLT
jgi:hypothetical protein